MRLLIRSLLLAEEDEDLDGVAFVLALILVPNAKEGISAMGGGCQAAELDDVVMDNGVGFVVGFSSLIGAADGAAFVVFGLDDVVAAVDNVVDFVVSLGGFTAAAADGAAFGFGLDTGLMIFAVALIASTLAEVKLEIAMGMRDFIWTAQRQYIVLKQ